RQALPPLFVLSLLGGAVLAILFPLFRLLLAIEVSLYAIILILTACQTAIRQKKLALIIGLPLAIAVMHITWGAGFLWSMIK
ncbi:MAG: glycosyltransferase family 2 protein, partial [Anaerolineales bacterium]|nr:glycosyltransferase family 2 protein [Anaerolineales bacterium]